MAHVFRLRLTLTPDPSGGFVVTSPDLPELVSEGESAAEALSNVRDALEAVRELYEDLDKRFPPELRAIASGPVEFETLIDAA